VRSAFAPVVVPLVALIALIARWLLQGSGNFYTAREQRFWVKDPDLDWRVSSGTAIWIGLEVCGIVAAVACGLVAAGWIIRRRERRTQHPAKLLRAAAWVVAVVPLAVPMAAFASGWGPADGHVIRPVIAAPTTAGEASPDRSPHRAAVTRWSRMRTSTVARLGPAGTRSTRSSRATSPDRGRAIRDLTKPMTAELRAAAASVDTGIGDRTKHAREGYLQADVPASRSHSTRYSPRSRTVPTRSRLREGHRRPDRQDACGRGHRNAAQGRRRDARPAAPTGEILLAKADFTIVIRETGLDAGDFDGDVFPIHVSLVLRHTSG
jgi:hypothetical protein